jgi:hypothetical protein
MLRDRLVETLISIENGDIVAAVFRVAPARETIHHVAHQLALARRHAVIVHALGDGAGESVPIVLGWRARPGGSLRADGCARDVLGSVHVEQAPGGIRSAPTSRAG